MIFGGKEEKGEHSWEAENEQFLALYSMSTSTLIYDQLLSLLSRPRQLLQVGEPAQRTASQYSQYRDFRHQTSCRSQGKWERGKGKGIRFHLGAVIFDCFLTFARDAMNYRSQPRDENRIINEFTLL